jgi:RimJ/RimL family protein N-acetyltransferase
VIDLPPDRALVVETPRLQLVPLSLDELNDLYPVLGDDRIYAGTGERPPTEEELIERLHSWRARRSVDGSQVFLTWVIRLVPAGEPLGYCRAAISDDASAEISCLVSPDYCGRGIATEAVDGMIRALRGPLGVGELRARVRADNAPGQALARHAGMHRSGLRGGDGEVWFSPRPD